MSIPEKHFRTTDEDTVSFALVSACRCFRNPIVIDFSQKYSSAALRLRMGLLLAAAAMPFLLVLVMAYFWVYQPLQEEVKGMSRDIEVRFESVARLQVALVRGAMPVNDYLIHGHEQERREYQLAVGRIEAAFALLRGTIESRHVEELRHLSSIHQRWRTASGLGERILRVNAEQRRSPQAAIAMEQFDEQIDRLVDEAEDLLEHVRKELAHSRDQLELRRERLTWFVALSALIATMVTLSAVLYLNQRVIRPLERLLDDESN